jgi:hypothetical protein
VSFCLCVCELQVVFISRECSLGFGAFLWRVMHMHVLTFVHMRVELEILRMCDGSYKRLSVELEILRMCNGSYKRDLTHV